DNDAQIAYQSNQENYLGNHPFILGNIKDQNPEKVPDFDILLGGFPCQPFSNAGNRKGVEDPRGTLFAEVERFIKSKKPIAFVLENVKGILSSKMPDGTFVTDEIIKRLSKVECENGEIIRYNIPKATLLKSNEYGVPQQRQRVFIIGIREELQTEFNFDLLCYAVKKDSLQKLTLKDVLKDIPDHVNHVREYWQFSPQASQLIPLIKRSWKDIPLEYLPPRFKKIRDQMKKYHAPNFYRRFGLDEINGTIIASAQPENCGIIHPLENRRFTIREIARIQSFPDDYDFPCKSIEGKYKVIGNAVPPVLAFVIAKTLYDHLTGSSMISNHNYSQQLSLNLF
ncbi:MAG TPA: DNA (cytosine-5-)-methyltransferase, partial [Allocoleopsis sp.]